MRLTWELCFLWQKKDERHPEISPGILKADSHVKVHSDLPLPWPQLLFSASSQVPLLLLVSEFRRFNDLFVSLLDLTQSQGSKCHWFSSSHIYIFSSAFSPKLETCIVNCPLEIFTVSVIDTSNLMSPKWKELSSPLLIPKTAPPLTVPPQLNVTLSFLFWGQQCWRSWFLSSHFQYVSKVSCFYIQTHPASSCFSLPPLPPPSLREQSFLLELLYKSLTWTPYFYPWPHTQQPE